MIIIYYSLSAFHLISRQGVHGGGHLFEGAYDAHSKQLVKRVLIWSELCTGYTCSGCKKAFLKTIFLTIVKNSLK